MERFSETYRVLQPMKYSTSKKKEVLDAALADPNYCIQLKKDGSSYLLAKDLDGSVHLYSNRISKRTGEVIDKIENVPHLKSFARDNFPDGSQLLVEICYGESSKDVNSIMLALPPKAIERQKDNLAGAYIFDILYWANESYWDKDFGERWDKVLNIVADWRADYQKLPSWLTVAETHYTDKGAKLAEWLAAGEEGGVLKMLKSTKKTSAAHAVRELGATAGRPMNTTFKIKQVDTVDVIIIGVEMPTKEYTGKDPDNYQYRDEDDNPVNRLWKLGYANSFVIGALDKDGKIERIGTVASGLDDEMRAAAAADPDEFIGAVIEVDCMSIDKAARTLRHPRLMKMRPDKLASNCLIEEIFA